MVKSKSSPTISLETGMLAYARSIQITEGLFFGINLKVIPSLDILLVFFMLP